MRRPFLALVLVLATVGCGGGDDGGEASTSTTEPCRKAAAGAVAIVAEGQAWDTACLQIPADNEVVITIANQDPGVNHNLRVKGLEAGAVFTKLEPGPVEQQLPVTAPVGSYPFVCDIHPNMVGELLARDS